MRNGNEFPSIVFDVLLPGEILANFLLKLIDSRVAGHLKGKAISEAIAVHLLVRIVDRDIEPIAWLQRRVRN